MTVSRRTVLTLSLSALAAPALIRPGRAACRPVDLDKGISFTRQDGITGFARRDAGGDLYIEHLVDNGNFRKRLWVRNGVFETKEVWLEEAVAIVGGGPPTYTRTFSPKPIWPEDGATWHGKVKEEVVTAAYDGWHKDQVRWTATYRCFDPREVTLSGCTYRALTVEATLVSERGSKSQRWAYFPDLELGLETRLDGVKNGITALTPV